MTPPVDEVRIELSVVDLPEAAAERLHAPTLRQSQDVTLSVYNGFALGTDSVADLIVPSPFLRFALQAPVVWFTAELPIPTQTWMHEEWHRAAMRVEGVHSRNGNSPRLWQGTVYDVTDADLARLKRTDPPAFNRSLSAGIEAEVELNRRVVREDLLFREHSHLPALLLYDAYHVWHYLRLSAGPVADDIREWNLEHQGPERERDFAGLDPVALARDLHRPDEPYSARGPHPSGEGIARAVAWSDLTDEEQRWLVRQRDWSLVNFVSPMAFLVHHVPVGDVWLNGLLHHRPTSFGSRTGLDLLARAPGAGLTAMVAVDRNLTAAPFFTVDLGLVRIPVHEQLSVSPRLVGWWQPRALDPYETRGMPGGLVSLRTDVGLGGRTLGWVEVEGKSAGEVSGNPYLGPMGAVRAGLTLETTAGARGAR